MVVTESLPHLNALLNGISTTLLLTGWYSIRKGFRERHRWAMLGAFTVSVGFLVSYLVYHFEVGSVRFGGEGFVRAVYLTILSSHAMLAVTVPPLAIITLIRALRGDFVRHKRLAAWTLPVWLYVNVTGILVYILVYHLNPAR